MRARTRCSPSLFTDRDVTVRREAVARYAQRVVNQGAKVEPIEEVLRAGARELMLPAAEAAAFKKLPSALRPLLLYVRAGEEGERERALLALGTLGDARALAELETVAAGGTPEAPAEPSMVVAAIEGLGRLAPKLPEGEDRKRVEEKVESEAMEARTREQQQAGVRGLRYIGGERARVKTRGAAHRRQHLRRGARHRRAGAGQAGRRGGRARPGLGARRG